MSSTRMLASFTAAIVLVATPALAAPEGSANDAAGIAEAKVSLSAAIAEAEKHAKGKAVHAEFEKVDGRAIYEVEVAVDSKVMDVQVDAEKGTVIASKEDRRDGEESDKED